MLARLLDTDHSGQALAEFALILPMFMLLILATLDVGRVVLANDVLASAAREGARYASVHGSTPPGCNNTVQRPCVTTPATKAAIKTYTLGEVAGGAPNPSVTVCYSGVHIQATTEGCSGDVDEAGATNSRGALVTVRVSTTVQLVTGTFIGLGNFNVSGTSTMLINN